MTRYYRRGGVVGVLMAIGLVAASWSARASEPVKSRAGWVAAPAHLLPVIMARPGLTRVGR